MSNESIDRFLSKTEEKRARAHIKEMELKEAHSELLDQKRKFDHKASEKTKEAVEVENQVCRFFCGFIISSRVRVTNIVLYDL